MFQTLIGKSTEEAAEFLNEGQIIGIPTETVYGLAGNGLDTAVVSKIFEAKNRPYFDPLILHFKSLKAVNECVESFPTAAKILAETFWPGPLTLILPKSAIVPDLVTAGSSGVAVRVPSHELTLKLLQKIPFPLAAPSANPFKYVSPTSAQHVYDQLQNKIPYILDGGNSEIGIESTIVSFLDKTPRILRFGGIPTEEIIKICPDVIIDIQHAPNQHESPGQLEHHYSPNCILRPFSSPEYASESQKCVKLYFKKPADWQENKADYFLSETGDLKEAAARLFSVLREFDAQKIEKVYFEWLPEQGLGRAINDRLKRASSHYNALG